jgi:hypothetical protein
VTGVAFGLGVVCPLIPGSFCGEFFIAVVRVLLEMGGCGCPRFVGRWKHAPALASVREETALFHKVVELVRLLLRR